MSPPTETPAREPLTTADHPQLLFFDGRCAFCARWVARVIAADRARRARFATIQGTTFQRLLAVHPGLGRVKSVVLVQRRRDGREILFIRSMAVRKLISGLPGFRLFSLLLHLVPTPMSDFGYRVFSRLREPLFGRWADRRPDFEKVADRFLE